MKLFFLVLALTAVTFAKADYDEKKFLHLASECGQELSIKPEDVLLVLRELIDGADWDNCLPKCIMQEMGFFDEDGIVQVDNYNDIIPEDDPFRKTLPLCRHIVVKTCEDAITLGLCTDSALRQMKLQ